MEYERLNIDEQVKAQLLEILNDYTQNGTESSYLVTPMQNTVTVDGQEYPQILINFSHEGADMKVLLTFQYPNIHNTEYSIIDAQIIGVSN